MQTLTGTNPADAGEVFTLQGANEMRRLLADPETTIGVKTIQLYSEFGQLAKYHNWLFDRIQELRNGHHRPTGPTGPAALSNPEDPVDPQALEQTK